MGYVSKHLVRGSRQYIATGLLSTTPTAHHTRASMQTVLYSYRHNQHSWLGTASNYW